MYKWRDGFVRRCGGGERVDCDDTKQAAVDRAAGEAMLQLGV